MKKISNPKKGGKMKRIIFTVIVVVAMLFLSACGGGGKTERPSQLQQVYFPDWWQIQDSEEYLHTFGMAERASQNTSFDAAKANAMLEAAQYVEAYVKGMVKNYEEEAGVDNPQITQLTSKVVKVVADAKFTKTNVTKQEALMDRESGKYKTFIRVSIPKDSINKNLVNQIKNEEALYNAFKASQAFDELDKELDK